MKDNYILSGILVTIIGIKSKLITLLSAAWGWLLLTLGAVLNFYIPVKDMFLVLFLVLFIDSIVGFLASKKNGEGFISSKARNFFYKLLIYLMVLCLVFLVEYLYAFTTTTKILFGLAYAVELISIVANTLILKPDMPFLRLLSGTLISEIANKTKMNESEVKEILENEDNK